MKTSRKGEDLGTRVPGSGKRKPIHGDQRDGQCGRGMGENGGDQSLHCQDRWYRAVWSREAFVLDSKGDGKPWLA